MVAQPLELPLDLGQPAAQVLAIVFFLIPGLNCTWLIERLAGRTPLSGTERLLRAIAWSLAIYALASLWLVRMVRLALDGEVRTPWEPIVGVVLLEFAAPAVVALAVVRLRRSDWFRALLRKLTKLDARATSWDYAFASPDSFFLRAKLRTGERVGGVFGPDSFASAYPEPPDLFLEQAWRLDADGVPEGPMPGSRGMLLRMVDVETLEFLDLEGDGGGKREVG